MILPYSHYYIYMAIAAFSAGVFEETGRVVGLGVLRKGKPAGWMQWHLDLGTAGSKRCGSV